MSDQTAPPESSSKNQSTRIRGNMGAIEIAFFTVAAAGPLLVVAGFLPVAFLIGGAGAVGAQVLAGLVLVLFAVGLTRMALRITNSGAFYAYIGRGLGKPAGGGAAYLAVTAYAVIVIGQFGAIGAFSKDFFSRALGIEVPWLLFSLVAIAIVAFLGFRQISLSAKVLGAALLTEAGILLVLAVPVLLDGGAEGYDLSGFTPTTIFAGAGAGAMFAIAFGAFIGFESTAIYSEEAKDPKRTLPRAVYLAVGFLTIFYGFMAWVLVVAYGSSNIQEAALADPVGLVFVVMESYVGYPAVIVTEILLITSSFASVLAFHNTASRYLYALGRERMLPQRLAAVQPKHGSPYIASATMSVFALICTVLFFVLGADPYLQVFLLGVAPGVIAIIFLQALCSVAIVAFFTRKEKNSGLSIWSTVVAPSVSAVLLFVACYLVVTNFEYFTAREDVVNWLLLSIIPLVFVLGIIRTLVMKSKHPDEYSALTETKVY
jgi:amino acid transporter